MGRALAHIGPDGAFFALATLLLARVIARFGGHLSLEGASLAAPLETFVPVILFCALLRRQHRSGWNGTVAALGSSARAFAPMVLIDVLYHNLSAATPFLPGRSVERALLAIDQRIFGIEPSAWIQRFATPLLSDYMAFSYGLLFVLPFSVLALLFWRRRDEDFRELSIALLASSFAGFLLYIAFPARSPRWACPAIYGAPLRGAFGIYELLTHAWDHVELMLYDAFPSLHTAVSTIALAYAWRLGPKIFPRRPRALALVMFPLVASLQVSTLYLRQHYLVDVIGGWLLAAGCVAFAARFSRAWALLVARLCAYLPSSTAISAVSASSTARANLSNAA
jgi:membrane-associated phospholipid phosphatase